MSLNAIKNLKKPSGILINNFKQKFALQNLKKNIPLSVQSFPKTMPKHQIEDREKLKSKFLLDATSKDISPAGINFKQRAQEMKTFSYLNKIQIPQETLPPSQTYFNRADEINKKFELKKVVPRKESRRVGVLGYKVGMTGTWDRWGTWFPLTVVKIDNCQVTHVKSKGGKDGYDALQVGVGEKDSKRTTKSMIGHFIKNDLPIKRDVREFKITAENTLPIGYMLTARHFVPGQSVDVRGISKGKGMQGVMYRWNFSGGFATHGCSIRHRSGVTIY
jgi:50S ribosomal protein uL3